MLKAATQAFMRFSTASAVLPAFALVLGVGGAALDARKPEEPKVAAPAPLDPDAVKIDAVLARKAPELGLELRQRIAVAIIEESHRANLDPLFVLGLINVESEFAEAAVSNKGARGLMQLTPVTLEFLAAREGLKVATADLYRDPALQVRLGIRYLAKLEQRFGSLDLALMAYNAGPEKLKNALKDGDIDRFRNYVRAVRRGYASFRRGELLFEDSTYAQAAEVGPALPDALPAPADVAAE